MQIQPIQQTQNYRNNNFKGSVDKPVKEYLVNLQKSREGSILSEHVKKNCNAFLESIEAFMAKTNKNTILTVTQPKVDEFGNPYHGLKFRDTETGSEILADEFVVPATAGRSEKKVELNPLQIFLAKHIDGSYQDCVMWLKQWVRMLSEFSSPEEVDLALKAQKNNSVELMYQARNEEEYFFPDEQS